MAAGKKSKSQEAYSSRYKSTTFALNRKKKLERVLKDQPNNEQAKMAIKDIHYRRKTPNTTVWLASAKAGASLVASFTKNTNVALNTKAMPKNDTISARNMFSLKTRIRNAGNYIFADSLKVSGFN